MMLRSFAVLLCLFANTAVACVPPTEGAAEPGSESLIVLEPQLERTPSRGGAGERLATLISLKNTADNCLDEVVVQVRYFDAARKQIDSTTQSFHDVVVPPGKTVAYRLVSEPLRPLADYVSQEVSVVSAQPAYYRARPGNKGFVGVLTEWLPFLLFFAVFVYFVVFQVRSKKSPQNRILELQKEQMELQRAQVQQLQRIGDLLEARARRDGTAQ